MKSWKQKVGQTALSVVCVALTLRLTDDLDGTEFSGGRITGPLLNMADIAILLFALSLLFVLWLPRITAVLAGIASLLCLPLSLLFLAPGPFRRLVGGEWSTPLYANFVLTRWTVGWFLALVASLMAATVILLRPAPKQD